MLKSTLRNLYHLSGKNLYVFFKQKSYTRSYYKPVVLQLFFSSPLLGFRDLSISAYTDFLFVFNSCIALQTECICWLSHLMMSTLITICMWWNRVALTVLVFIYYRAFVNVCVWYTCSSGVCALKYWFVVKLLLFLPTIWEVYRDLTLTGNVSVSLTHTGYYQS